MAPNKKKPELNVNLSYKVKNGSIKVSESDLKILGLGIVEEVVVSKVGDENGLTLMLFSDSHIKSGNVIMGISDASGMDLEKGDKITIVKLSDYRKLKKTRKAEEKENIKGVSTDSDEQIKVKINKEKKILSKKPDSKEGAKSKSEIKKPDNTSPL
jgi:uncharacterized Zn ribbon protein